MIWSVWISGRVPVRLKLCLSITRFLGDWSDGDTPGPISNPAVKPVSADGTGGAAPWESRSSPRNLVLFLGNLVLLFLENAPGFKPGFLCVKRECDENAVLTLRLSVLNLRSLVY